MTRAIAVYEPYFAWEDSKEDGLFESNAQKLREDLSAYAASIGADNPFLYLDYADITQKPLESYGADNVAKIRAAAAKNDPDGVFQYMMAGGFKISQVRRYSFITTCNILTDSQVDPVLGEIRHDEL